MIPAMLAMITLTREFSGEGSASSMNPFGGYDDAHISADMWTDTRTQAP